MSEHRSLLPGLRAYHHSIERLNTQTDQVFTQLERRWQALRGTYDVDAASLKVGWLETVSRFLEYQSSLDRLSETLVDRIDALEEGEPRKRLAEV